MRVREKGDYEGWVLFFCECLEAGAEDAQRSLLKLVELHDESSRKIRENLSRGAVNALSLLELLEAHPIVTVSMVRDGLGVSRTTASNLVDDFVSLGILVETDASRQRYRTFAYEDYLSILREGGDPL
jgi:Fic family protein